MLNTARTSLIACRRAAAPEAHPSLCGQSVVYRTQKGFVRSMRRRPDIFHEEAPGGGPFARIPAATRLIAETSRTVDLHGVSFQARGRYGNTLNYIITAFHTPTISGGGPVNGLRESVHGTFNHPHATVDDIRGGEVHRMLAFRAWRKRPAARRRI